MLQGNRAIFSRDWTNVFNAKIEDKFVCVICFKYKKIGKINSRKSNTCFFTAHAECKFSNCLRFKFTIQNEPFTSRPVNITVNYEVMGTLSPEHSNVDIAYSRKLSNSLRLQVASNLTDKSVGNYFYEQFPHPDCESSALSFGNFNNVRSACVLRKAKFDLSCLQRFSNDNWSELSGLQEYYRNITVNNILRGYIQSLGHDPFIVHMYSQDQIQVLNYFKGKKVIVHLDSTGSIIRKINSSQKRVFYYALTIRHPEVTTSPLPLAEMISSAHSSAEISYFLHKWSLDSKKVLSREINIGHVEIDYSWALIHSVCNAFIKSDIFTYLEKCWKLLFSQEEVCMQFGVILHLCSAHLINGIAFNVNKKFKLSKPVRKLFLHTIGYMINCTQMINLDSVFMDLCYVFLNRNFNKNVEKHIQNLESFISYSKSCDDEYVEPEDSNDLTSFVEMRVKPIAINPHLVSFLTQFMRSVNPKFTFE